MKTNKGFAQVGIIIALVAALIVGGGVVYLVTRTPTPSYQNTQDNNYQPPVDQNQNPPTTNNNPPPATSTACNSNSSPSITVISPNGGETYISGQEVNIKWKSCNVLGDVFVALHKDGGWNDVVSLSDSTPNDGSETFAFAQALYPGSYKISIGSASAKVQQDFSDNLFTISSSISPSITVLSPNGGETWAKGTAHIISWQDDENNVPKFYDIKLVTVGGGYAGCSQSPEGCSPVYNIARNIQGTSYNWSIPNCTADNPCSSNFSIPIGSYAVQVCQTGTTYCDSSNNEFIVQ